MAMISRVAEEAKKTGAHLRTVVAHRLIQDYVKKNPVSRGIFGADPPKVTAYPAEVISELRNPVTFPKALAQLRNVVCGGLIATVVLSDGPALTMSDLTHYGNYIRASESATPEAIAIVDKARRIQAIRDKRVGLWVLSPEISWELED
jgi:hypothetical protein